MQPAFFDLFPDGDSANVLLISVLHKLFRLFFNYLL